MTQQVLQYIVWGIVGIISYFLIFYVLFEIKIDRTVTGDILLWYTGYDWDGNAHRKYIILFKKTK
jgi:hypothetical protein